MAGEPIGQRQLLCAG